MKKLTRFYLMSSPRDMPEPRADAPAPGGRSGDGFKLKPYMVGGGFLLFFLIYFVSLLAHDAWNDTSQGKVFTADKTTDAVVARAWVEPPSSSLKGQFRCWISLQNLTGKPVDQIRFVTVRRFHAERNRRTDVDEITAAVDTDLLQAFRGRGPGAANRALASGDRQTFWTTFHLMVWGRCPRFWFVVRGRK
jgi:hypothetical protein